MKRFNLLKLFTLFIAITNITNLYAYTVKADVVNGTELTIDYSKYDKFKTEKPKDNEKQNAYNLDNENLDIILTYPCNKLTFKAATYHFIAWGRAQIAVDASYNDNETNWDDHTTIYSQENYFTGEDKTQTLDNLTKNIKKIAIKNIYNGAVESSGKYIYDIKFTIAPHILLENNLEDNNYTFPNAIEIDKTDKYLVNFKSFLSSSNGAIEVSSSNTNDFKIEYNGKLEDKVVSIAGSNAFCSTTDDTKNFNVVFTPQSAKTTSSTITIKDTGSGETIQFIVTATGKKKTPTITWTPNTQIIVGESLNLSDVVQSNCGTAITFDKPSDETVLKIENGKLIALSEGFADIKITTAGNDIYASIPATKTFETTTKTLQEIVWSQDFYLLKLGDADITLNAYAINKETNTANGNLIEYSIAEGGENVVTITNGVLHIVGKGQTMITAHQRGDNEYAGTYITKPIIVREVSDDCSNNYALAVTKKEEEGGSGDGFNYSTLSVTHKLSTIGDKLSFSTSCAGGATGRSVKVKDQNGKEIYNSGSFGSVSNIPINRDVTQLTFEVRSNFNHSISNILVTPAIYLESKQQSGVDFGTIPVNSSIEKTITIDWANKPDMMWATTDNEHFTVVSNSNFGGTCGDHGSTEIKVKFDPTIGKKYTGNLLIDVGNDGNPDLTIPLSATATKINHTLNWNNTENEIELNSIFNCNVTVSGNHENNPHAIKYAYDTTYFYGMEEYPSFLYAKKAGTTTITAYIEATETCADADATFTVTILPEKPTMTWEQDLSNYVESQTAQTVTLNAESNKEGNIIYEIMPNGDDIISLSGNQLTIKAGVTGSAEIKAYNANYKDVFVIKNVIVASTAPCNTEFPYSNLLETDNSTLVDNNIIAEETIDLTYKCKSISFKTDLTGDGLNGSSYGTVTVYEIVNGVEKQKGDSKRFYDDGLSESDATYDIDQEATQIKLVITATSVVGSWTSLKATLTDIKTILASNFDNYTTDKESIDFGTFSVGTSSVTKNLKISYWSLPGNINLSIESGNTTRATSPFSIDNTTLTDNCGIGEKTVNVTLNPTVGGTFKDYLVIKTGGDEVVEKIPLTAIINKANQSIEWTSETSTTADRQVQLAKSNQGVLMNYEVVSGSEYAKVENNSLNIPSITILKAGTFKVKAYNSGNESYNAVSAEKEFTSTIGTIRFDNNAGDKHWSNPNNWVPVSNLNKQRNVEPSAIVNAVIAAKAEISNDANTGYDEINDLTIAPNGKLTITATSALKANKVTNTVAENLILKASADGNATLIYADGEPKATVEMYSKAENGTLNHTDGKDPQWQYMGVAVDGTTTSAFSNAWLLKWTEAESAVNGDPWTDAPLANTALAPWAGYSISQPKAATYSTTGTLMRGDHTYTLTRTESTDPDCGFNLLANSYTAPIDITKLTTDNFENADACIILYNTGTYADWESQQGKSGQNPGQLTVIPVATGETTGLPTTIASMQAFFVKANENNASFTVDYETAVTGATNKGNQMRAPRAHEEFNVLKIMIEGENSRDRLFLLENEETTDAYDNGYEARKIFDAPRGHQMYATCEYGYASIDCSESFVGQTIGLKGDNEGEMLTISFDTDRLEGYQSLYLYDKVTGKYVNILSGEKYTFFGIKGANDNRFSIVTNPDDKAQTPPFVIIGNELAFDKSQIDADNANIYIYDTSGRLLMTDKINPHENYNIPNMPEGIYLINMNGYTTKIVRK